MGNDNKKTTYAQFIMAMVIVGTIGIFRRNIALSSAALAFSRGILGSLSLGAFVKVRGQKIFHGMERKKLFLLILNGAIIGVNWIFLFEAYNYTSVAAATMCYYMAPVIVILLSPLVFGEKITLREGLCAAVAVFGMVLVSDVLQGGLHGAKGLVFGLIAACLYACIVIVNRKLSGISAEDRTILQFAVSAVVMLPYVLLTENVRALAFTPLVTVLLLLLGIVHTGFAYVLYFGNIPLVPAQTAALLSYLDPVVAVLLSVTVLREPMSLPAALGAVLVLGAMIVSELEPGKRA